MGNGTTKKRRGFTIRYDNRPTTPAQRKQRLAEHQFSKSQIGDRKRGALVSDRLISKMGAGKYGALLKKLYGVAGKDS